MPKGFPRACPEQVTTHLRTKRPFALRLDNPEHGTARKLPNVLHGSDDHDVPVEASRELAKLLGVELEVLEGETHTLIRRHWGKTILPRIVAAASKNQSKF